MREESEVQRNLVGSAGRAGAQRTWVVVVRCNLDQD